MDTRRCSCEESVGQPTDRNITHDHMLQLGLPRDAQLPLLGHDGFFYVREPQQMKNLESVNVVAARASMSHSLLLTNLGTGKLSVRVHHPDFSM